MHFRTGPAPALVPDRRGATTVEMALVAPVLFLLVFGTFEFAHAFMVQNLIQDAARQGCRSAICPRQTNAAVTSKVDDLLRAEGIRGATTSILVNDSTGDLAAARAGDKVQVRVTIPSSSVSLFPKGSFLRGEMAATYTLRYP